MVLSEAEAEARLTALRRERDALDRAITELALYLELGRRLSGAGSGPTSAAAGETPAAPPANPVHGLAHPPSRPEEPKRGGPSPTRHGPGAAAASSRTGARDEAGDAGAGDARAGGLPSAPPGEARGGSGEGPAFGTPGLSEAVLARRHGRALIEAALAALEAAGRPLHASEILAALARQGFALPGHDPVAALNTRLWKRSGAGGPLRRLGDAVYALPEDEAAPR